MAVDMQLLKQLRDATFAPLKDCKEALEESNGVFEEAQEILRKKGILKAGKKGDRETNEGIVKLVQRDGRLAGVKILCETDFVAKNETFTQMADLVLEKLLATKKQLGYITEVDGVWADEIKSIVAEFAGKIGENVKIGGVMVSDAPSFVYNHPGNKVASIIYFEGTDTGVAKELALQVAAMAPTYTSFEEVPVAERTRLKEEFTAEMAASGKPANIIEQIVDGKIRKNLADYVLLEQEYIRDGAKKIKDILPAGFVLSGFLRLAI